MNPKPRRTPKQPLARLAFGAVASAIAAAFIYHTSVLAAENASKKDPAASRAAFLEVYKVLMSPRCMNCHPSGDRPLQGDDSHVHIMNVKRGDTGKGKYAMKCGACHQDQNVAGLNMPPGNPNWHLPPAKTRMIFQGKSPRDLALQLVDPKQNGGKSMEQLREHAHDGLVLWGWDPGDGRTKPPLSHEEFARQWQIWIDNGGEAPE
jgi:mono/diheme cytochrome c family protein